MYFVQWIIFLLAMVGTGLASKHLDTPAIKYLWPAARERYTASLGVWRRPEFSGFLYLGEYKDKAKADITWQRKTKDFCGLVIDASTNATF